MTVEKFIAALQAFPSTENLFNPWKDHDPAYDISPDAPAIRADQLRRYFSERQDKAKLILMAEAAGYQGCHFSGIAMTSERIIMDKHPDIRAKHVFSENGERTSNPATAPKAVLAEKGFNEPTASIVWKTLLGESFAPTDWVNWNILPFHPHKAGNTLTNRTPKPAEVEAAHHFLPQFLKLFPNTPLVAVGNISHQTLTALGHESVKVRHPANGGATAFKEGIRALKKGK